MSTTTFLQERLTAKKALLTQIDNALTALGSNATVESYEINTGQTTQQVRRAEMDRWYRTMRQLEEDIFALEERLNGYGGVAYGRPSF